MLRQLCHVHNAVFICCRPQLLQACRSVSSSSDVLQLSHSGLRPQQLHKVAMALAAAPWIRRLDLSGALQQWQPVNYLAASEAVEAVQQQHYPAPLGTMG
jgi:hypothetical protein